MATGVYIRTEEAKRNMSEARKGKHHSEETKWKISNANKGEKHYLYGKHHTEEAKQKMSEARKGRKRIEKAEVICQYCEKLFKVYPILIKMGGGKYCSRECCKLKRRCKNGPYWKGGKRASYERAYNKKKKNLKYQLNNKITRGINYSLREGIKNHRHWEDLVLYGYKQLKQRLKFTMPIGYTWQDFLDGKLHIDHIIPINAFKFNKPEDFQFQKCWALSNLRLLPAKQNRKKYNKIIEPFQTCLEI